MDYKKEDVKTGAGDATVGCSGSCMITGTSDGEATQVLLNLSGKVGAGKCRTNCELTKPRGHF